MAKSKAKSKPAQTASTRIFDDVLALAGSLLRNRKDLGAEKLQALAEATREYASTLTDIPTLKAQAMSASENIDGFADYVMHTDIENMASDANAFARNHPLAAFGITVAAGIVASRIFMGSSSQNTKKVARPQRSNSSRKAKPAARARTTNGAAHANA